MANNKKVKRYILGIILIILLVLAFPKKNIKSIKANTNNYFALNTNVEVIKVWDDEGNEDKRPTSTTFKLYDSNDMNTVVSTISLTNSMAIDDYTWQSWFMDVPLTDSNDNIINYVVKEETNENYISIYDPTARPAIRSYADDTVKLRIKFNENTKLGHYDAVQIAAHLADGRWYTTKNEFFKDEEIGSTIYELGFDNDTMELQNNTPNFLNAMNSYGRYDSTGGLKECFGNDLPETRHPIPVGDWSVWKYKISPKSNIEWYIHVEMDSWGGDWGMAIDEITPIGSNVFVNTYNLQDIDFLKTWDDVGFENLRGTQEFELYANDVLVDTIQLNSEDFPNLDEWRGSFKNLPIYDSNFKKIEYRIKEKENTKYTTIYEDDYYNGLAITFSDGSITQGLEMYALMPDDTVIKIYRGATGWAYGYNNVKPIDNATIYCPSKNFYLNASGENIKLKIVDIKPIHTDVTYGSSGASSINLNNYYPIEATGDNYLDVDYSFTYSNNIWWHYVYSDTFSYGNSKIINKINKYEVTKEWNDEGFENVRPNKIDISIYNRKAPNTVVKRVSLTSDDVFTESNIWKKVVTEVPYYNPDGTVAEYFIKEDELENYITTYNNSENINGVVITLADDENINSFLNRCTIRVKCGERYWNYNTSFWNKEKNKVFIPNILQGTRFEMYIYVPNEDSYNIKSIKPEYIYNLNLNPDELTYINFGFSGYDIQNIYGEGPFSIEESENTRYIHYKIGVDALEETYTGSNYVINKANLKNIEFTKKWDDESKTKYRPESVTLKLYKSTDLNNPVQTVVLNADDYDSSAKNWNGVFYNVKELDDSGNKIKYIIKEDNVECYDTIYKEDLNALKISVGEVRGLVGVVYGYNEQSDDFAITTLSSNSNIVIPSTDGMIYFILQPNCMVNIKSIEKAKVKEEELITSAGRIDNSSVGYNVHDMLESENVEITNTDSTLAAYRFNLGSMNSENDEPFIGCTTIINKVNATEIEVEKIWDDNNDQDGKRPDEINVHLLANGDVIKNQKITAESNWKYTFEKLKDRDEENRKISYTVTEDSISDYQTSIEGFTITNKYAPEKISINGTKIWDDNNNQDGKRPQKITVKLLEDGNLIETKEVSSDTNWKYNFDNLDKYKNHGTEIDYTIVEEGNSEYEISYDGYDIINKYTPEKIEVSGAKVWDDNDDQDGIRPNEVTVNLLADGKIVNSKIISEEDNWIYSFKELPKYKDGKIIVYTVDEEDVENYTKEIDNYTIKNSHIPEIITINGTKKWEDSDDQDGKRPNKITVSLYDEEKCISSIQVDGENGWKYEFKNLPKFKNHGQEINYELKEEAVEGYETRVEGYDLINTYNPEKTVINIKKIWDDNDNQDGKRPKKVIVNILADGENVSLVELNEDENWEKKVVDLDKYKNHGKKIVYSIKEVEVEEYQTKIDGFTITNKYIPETKNIILNKYWDDENNINNKRPEKIKVNVLADGITIKTVEISAKDNWTYTLDELPRFKNKGKEISYVVNEEKVDGYDCSIDGYNITNKLIVENVEYNSPNSQKEESSIVEFDEKNNGGVKTSDTVIKYLLTLGIAVITIVIVKKSKYNKIN